MALTAFSFYDIVGTNRHATISKGILDPNHEGFVKKHAMI